MGHKGYDKRSFMLINDTEMLEVFLEIVSFFAALLALHFTNTSSPLSLESYSQKHLPLDAVDSATPLGTSPVSLINTVYVDPTLEHLHEIKSMGFSQLRWTNITSSTRSDFDDIMKAKLAILYDCFSPDGPVILGAGEKYKDSTWPKAQV